MACFTLGVVTQPEQLLCGFVFFCGRRYHHIYFAFSISVDGPIEGLYYEVLLFHQSNLFHITVLNSTATQRTSCPSRFVSLWAPIETSPAKRYSSSCNLLLILLLCCCCLHINRSGLNHTYPVIYVVANPVRGHKEVPRSTGHIMVTTRYSDQQGSKSRQKVMRLYKRWHRPIAKRFIKLSLLHIGSSLDRLGLLSPTHDQRSQQQIGQTRSNQF